MRVSSTLTSLVAGLTFTALQVALPAHAQEIKRTGVAGPKPPFSSTVSVPANARITFLSGNMADVANPSAPKGSYEAFGDTETQVTSILNKAEKQLEADGMTLGDVVKVNIFLAGDPKLGGKMDFAGLNAAYAKFFGSPTQPNKPVRTALQVAALAMPGGLVEIEMTAAKVDAPAK